MDGVRYETSSVTSILFLCPSTLTGEGSLRIQGKSPVLERHTDCQVHRGDVRGSVRCIGKGGKGKGDGLRTEGDVP